MFLPIMIFLFVFGEAIGLNVFPPDHDPNSFPGTSISPIPSCLTPDITWSTHESTAMIPDTDAFLTCQDHCLQSPTCDHFTWYNQLAMPFDSTCFLFNHPTTEFDCSNCISGPQSCTCSALYSCQFSDNFVGEFHDVEVETSCQDYCFKTEECNFYTWFEKDPFPELCLMFSSCEDKLFNCESCHSGPAHCEDVSVMTSTSTTATPTPTTTTATSTPTTTTPAPTTTHNVICDLLEPQKHGYWFCPPSTEVTTCHLECHPGYVSDNGTLIRCQYGEWSSVPTCVAAVALITGRNYPFPYNTVEIYGEGVHKKLPNLPDNRGYHSLDLVDSTVLLCGGDWTKTSCLVLTESLQWTTHSTTTSPRYRHSSVSMLGQLHLLGGAYSSSRSTTEHLMLPSEVWTVGFNLLESTYNACAAKIGPEEFIVTGGTVHRSSVVLYNVTSGASTRLQNLNTPRQYHGCAYIRDSNTKFKGVIVAGSSNSSEMYDLESGVWSTVGQLTTGRQGVTMVVLGENILAMGQLSSVDKFNLTSRNWESTEAMLEEREFHGVTGVPPSSVGLDKN